MVRATVSPALCIVAQGAKVVVLGREIYAYDPSRMIAYDRVVNPGIPAQTLSILPFDPFQNWIEVGIDLVAATRSRVSRPSTTTLIPRSTVAPVTSPSSEPSISLMSALAGPSAAPTRRLRR